MPFSFNEFAKAEMYTVYVLYSEDFDKIYIGYTINLEQRFLSHNVLGTKGWAIRYKPWRIIHSETYESKSEAMRREKQLKGGQGRMWIHEMLKGKK